MPNISALALLLLALQSPRWTPIGNTGDGNPVLVNARSVKKKGTMVDATVRVQFLKPKKMRGGDVTSSRTTLTFDCAKEMFAVKENVYFFDEKTNKVFQRDVVKTPGFGPVMGGSMTKVAYDHLCKK